MDRRTDKKQIAELFRSVFNTVEGQKVLEILKKKFYINKSTVHISQAGLIDVNDTFYKEGKRRVILYILDLINNEEE